MSLTSYEPERCQHQKDYYAITDDEYAVKPGYNEVGFIQLAYNVRYIVVPTNSSLLALTLHSSVNTTLVYNDTNYSVPFMTL